MTKKYVKVTSLIVAVCLILVLSACSKSSTTAQSSNAPSSTPAATAQATTAPTATEAAPVTLKVVAQYSADDEKIGLDYAIAELKKAMPNVTLTIDPLPQDNGEIMKTRAATGDLPDIMEINGDLVNTFSKAGELVQMDDNADVKDFESKLQPGILDSQVKSSDGHVYALPVFGNLVHLWFYNKEIFAQNGVKVPTNYEELKTAVKAFTAKGIIPLTMFGKSAWPIQAYLESFLLRSNPGGTVDISSGKSKASDPINAAAITKAAELIKLGIFQKGATNFEYDQARELFNTGKAAMLINGDWEIPDAIKAIGDKADFMDNYPTADAGKEGVNAFDVGGFAGGGGYAVSAQTKDKDLSMKVAALLAYYHGAGRFVRGGHTDVVIKTDGLTPDKPMDPLTQRLVSLKPKLIFHAMSGKEPDPKFWTPFGEQVQNLVIGESADKFIANIDKLPVPAK